MSASAFGATRQRKLIFIGAILLLFFGLMVHRRVLKSSAEANSLQANNLGEVDLGGSISRFVLASFRGPLVCGLWWEARESQARHDYEQMEIVIRALTKLQPHFKNPWRYEAWNLAYNVAVEFDAIKDKYFYVAEGIRWLVEGERINRARIFDPAAGKLVEVGDPDMRDEIGYYLQDKMTVSDENQIYRILLHLSCIPPDRRDPVKLKNNPQDLEDFKQAYPQLIRRVQEYRYVPDGAVENLNRELLAILAEYRDVPSLYPSASDLKANRSEPSKPFPLWPETRRPANPSLEINQNAYDITLQWVEFAQEPLPPTAWEIRSGAAQPRDPRLTRRNSGKDELLFRATPARTRSLQARAFFREGWDELGQKAWNQAYEMWLSFGRRNNLDISWDELEKLKFRASLYYLKFPEYSGPGRPPPEYLKKDPELLARVQDSFQAFLRLKALSSVRNTSRYEYWLLTSDTCRTDTYREAARLWHRASRSRSDINLAIRDYDASMNYWQKLLVETKPLSVVESCGFRLHQACLPGLAATLALLDFKAPQPSQYGKDDQVQEELIRLEDEMLRAKARQRGGEVLKAHRKIWALGELSVALSQAPAAGVPALGLLTPPRGLSIEFIEDGIERQPGPFDVYVRPEVRDRIAGRDRGINRAPRTDVAPEVFKSPGAAPGPGEPAIRP
jgi:hypothetical protein